MIKLQASSSQIYKRESQSQVFFCAFFEIFKNTFLIEHFWVTASAYNYKVWCSHRSSHLYKNTTIVSHLEETLPSCLKKLMVLESKENHIQNPFLNVSEEIFGRCFKKNYNHFYNVYNFNHNFKT